MPFPLYVSDFKVLRFLWIDRHFMIYRFARAVDLLFVGDGICNFLVISWLSRQAKYGGKNASWKSCFGETGCYLSALSRALYGFVRYRTGIFQTLPGFSVFSNTSDVINTMLFWHTERLGYEHFRRNIAWTNPEARLWQMLVRCLTGISRTRVCSGKLPLPIVQRRLHL